MNPPTRENFKSFISHNVIRSHPVERVLCRDETDSQLLNVAARSDRGDLFYCVLTLWVLNRSLTINYKKKEEDWRNQKLGASLVSSVDRVKLGLECQKKNYLSVNLL